MTRRAITLPDLGEGVTEAVVMRWHVAAGDHVERDQPVVEVQTDKATVDIPAPTAGRVEKLALAEGTVARVGATLLTLTTDGTDAPPGRRPVRPASPRARRLARELGVDVDSLPGPFGAPVTEAIVRESAAAAGGEPLSPRRRSIADRLAAIQRDVPAVTVVEECDFTDVLEAPDPPPLLAWVVLHTARALGQHPDLNATFAGGRLRRIATRDLGIVVDTPRGALVPVLRRAETLTLDGVAAAVARLAAGARAGSLAPDELRGSSFTITSAGRFGGLFATPLVNAPEVAILGLHRVVPRPAVLDGAVVVRRIGFVSCTFDHRVVEGLAAEALLADLVERLAAAPTRPRTTNASATR